MRDLKSIGVMLGGIGAVTGLSILSQYASSRSLAEVVAESGFMPNESNADRKFASAIYDLSDAVETSATLAQDRRLKEMAMLMRNAAWHLQNPRGREVLTEQLVFLGLSRNR